MHSDGSGYDGKTSFGLTHEEIEYITLILEPLFQTEENPGKRGLLKRFKEAQNIINKHVQVDLQGDEEVECYHCWLMVLIEGRLKTLRDGRPEYVTGDISPWEIDILCTILAKLTISSDENDWFDCGSAAAAA